MGFHTWSVRLYRLMARTIISQGVPALVCPLPTRSKWNQRVSSNDTTASTSSGVAGSVDR